jgi:hypothetical protein
MFEPDNGKPININKKTEVKVLYDNEAIYISAMLYDNEPNKIQKEITNRDVFGVSDHFSVSINGFNDGQQDFRFFVSAAYSNGLSSYRRERRFLGCDMGKQSHYHRFWMGC